MEAGSYGTVRRSAAPTRESRKKFFCPACLRLCPSGTSAIPSAVGGRRPSPPGGLARGLRRSASRPCALRVVRQSSGSVLPRPSVLPSVRFPARGFSASRAPARRLPSSGPVGRVRAPGARPRAPALRGSRTAKNREKPQKTQSFLTVTLACPLASRPPGPPWPAFRHRPDPSGDPDQGPRPSLGLRHRPAGVCVPQERNPLSCALLAARCRPSAAVDHARANLCHSVIPSFR